MNDTPTFFRATTRRARKARPCCECAAEIAPGDTYESAFGVWAGEARSFATCAACLALREALIDATDLDYEEIAFGDLLEWVTEATRCGVQIQEGGPA